MTKTNTKRALVVSILSLLLCASMLIGTTFAWFTDSVSSANNIIKSGNLDIGVYYAYPSDVVDGDIPTDAWKPVTAEKSIFNNDALWEPGYTEAVFIKFVNEGSLALQYQLKIDILNEVIGKNKDGGDIQLSKYIQAYACNCFQQDYKDFLFTDRDIATDPTTLGAPTPYSDTLYNAANGEVATPSGDNPLSLDSWQWLEPEEKTYATLVLWMPETVGNEANHDGKNLPSIDLGISVLATQFAYENDSFGKDYDDDANFPPEYTSIEDLKKALENGENAALANDMELAEGEKIVIFEGDKVKLNLNGNTLGGTIEVADGAAITVENGTISNTDSSVSGIQTNGGDVVLNNVNIDSARHAVRVEGGTLTINGGVYKAAGTAGKTQHAVNVSDGGIVIINDGTFIGPKGTVSDSGSALNVQAGSTAIVNGGNFFGGKNNTLSSKGTLIVKGGTFDQDPSAYLANAVYYEAVSNNGVYTVSLKSNVAAISTADELVAFANKMNGVSSRSGNSVNTYILTADIDMSGKIWTPINKFSKMTFDGQGYTISNLAVSGVQRVGFFAEISGATVKNVNFDKATVVGNHWVGVVFGWEGAESLISYVENCTVTNSVITVSTINGDDGDKVGGIGGYAVTTEITDCSVESTTIKAYRDAAGILGYANGCKTVVKGNNVSDVEMVWDNSVNYKNYADVSEADLGVYVGEAIASAKIPVTTDNVGTLDDALLGGNEAVLEDDVSFSASETTANSGYGATGVKVNGGLLDGNGNTITVTDAWDTWDCAVNTTGGTIKNLIINSAMRGIFMGSASSDLYVDNVIIDGTVYTFNSDGGSKNYGVYISNSTLNGWTSFSDVHKEVVFTNCNFGEGGGYAFLNAYQSVTFANCDFAEGFEVNPATTSTYLTFENCTYNGVLITEENVADVLYAASDAYLCIVK